MLLGFLFFRLLPPVVYLPAYLLLLRQLGLVDTMTGAGHRERDDQSAAGRDHPDRRLPRDSARAGGSAWVDGVGRWGSFARICVPLVAPALAASWLLCLAFIWNEWMYASAIGYIEADRSRC